MGTRRIVTLIGLAAVAASAISSAALPVSAGDGVAKRAAKGELRVATMPVQLQQNGQTITVNKTLPFLSGGTIQAAQDALGVGAADQRLEQADSLSGPDLASASLGASPGSLGCSQRDAHAEHGNVRVNQDCTFRRQAEEHIAYNPADPTNLIAGQNDSRVGFNQCGIDWSTDNGHHWGDMLPPFRQKLNNPAAEEPRASDPNRHTIQGGDGTFHTYDADSDPAVAFDSEGRAYFSCVAFDIATNASMLWVTASPAGAHGSFYFNLPSFSRRFVVAEDNSPNVFHDKEFIRADTYATSPNHDNVYVTWTLFLFGCGPQGNGFCEAPVFGSMSTDHARHWSTPELVSGRNASLCVGGAFGTGVAGDADKCNIDQGSDPAVLPNGDLEVVFYNANTPTLTNQQLGVHCHPTGSSVAGTARLNCGTPTLVGQDVAGGEPQCDFGRGPEECIPGAYIRTNDFPRISTNTDNGHLYVTWQDYRNGEYDIQLSQSTDGGLTWHEVGTVNPDRGLDHYFPAVERGLVSGDRIGDSYYRTQRVANENAPANAFSFTPCPNPEVPAPPAPNCNPAFSPTSNSDYVLAGGTDGQTPYDFKVLSPVFPPPDGAQIGFNGDYSGLTINKGTDAHPIWSDTRNANPYPENLVAHDEDVFTQNVGLPNGSANAGEVGQVGTR